MLKLTKPLCNSVVETIYSDSNNVELLITPIEKNLGFTLGNLLRRMILSFTPGSAITSIRIDKLLHEYSLVPGMKEDVVDLILNLKLLLISMDSFGPTTLKLEKKGPSVVTGHDLIFPPEVSILNKEQYLCTLDSSSNLNMEIKVENGIGYVPGALYSSENTFNIPVDASFSPITHVCYRIKHFTFYEELILHVESNGTVLPIEAVESAMSLLSLKFQQFTK